MSQIDPTLWYVLHTQLVAGVTSWDLYLFPGDESGFVVSYYLEGVLVRTTHH